MILFKSSEIDKILLIKPTGNVPSLSLKIYLTSTFLLAIQLSMPAIKYMKLKKIVKIIVTISLVLYVADIL